MSTIQKNNALNCVAGEWFAGHSTDVLDVFNPATAEVLAQVPLASGEDVEVAVAAASAAFPDWRRTPPQNRIQFLFKFRALLEQHADEIARQCTQENGKTFAESRAELQRGIENVEVACGIPTLMQGYNLEDIASGLDETMIRQPLGVTAAITPFNFPAMIPLWFLPYAIACGNTFILKPSERVPLTAQLLVDLLHQTGLPKGVVNLVVGGKAAVDALLRHPNVRAISFVGSTPVARYIYSEGAMYGKRVQCQGGAKNYVVVMPDADLDMSAKIVSDSAFGCAGQRCLAVSAAITVGDAAKSFTNSITDIAASLKVGNGLEDGVQMGPVISPASKSRIESLIGKGVGQGGKAILDGRNPQITNGSHGSFLKPTILADIPSESELTGTEIFGPVLALQSAASLDEAIAILSRSKYGNQASIFTSSGKAARQFRYEAPAGNIGVNIGVAAPMAYFPFSGWKDSFLGVMHGQGRDGVEFYTEKKVVVERWPKEWSRKF
ncbi:MAG TPA: CoA-acylating methylmalonate-semialdehyde dehydrogenase [Bryobacteraceae bacterium]|jgi:malonate-semialdehyde dehydrogenase (acetylating)/methylmalonate-semialdehyde dehydrogenase|nr:CoA-acylating methylmalonate-semialdehyde dehydrogenase [Bryobacteraceae bacterium]